MIKILVSLALIFLSLEISNILNAKKIDRVKQYPLIALSIIFMVVMVAFFIQYSSAVRQLTNQYELINNMDVVLINVSLILGYTLFKGIVRIVLYFLCKNKDTVQSFAHSVYWYDEEFESWFLEDSCSNYRELLKYVVLFFALLTSLLISVTWIKGSESQLWAFIFPSAVLVVLSEIYNYFNGISKNEFNHKASGDASQFRRVSNYYKLRQVFENLIPEELLSSSSGCEFEAEQSVTDFISDLESSEDEIDQIVAKYFRLENRYKKADIDGIQSVVQLMHRKNVVVFNPFYRDNSLYVTLPIINSIVNGENVVVVCGRNSMINDVQEWLTDLIVSFSHLNYLWKVDFLSLERPNCNVGILSFNQLYDRRVLSVNKEFLRNTGLVILLEPSKILTTSQVALNLLSEEIDFNRKAVYCAYDRMTDGLVDTLSHVLHSDITDVFATPVPHCSYTSMLWNNDGNFTHQKLFDKEVGHLGNGIELAAIAVKNQVPKATWYGESKAPIKDLKWIAGQNYATICKYMNIAPQQKALYDKVNFVSNLWNSPKENEQFLIVEDEFCNMFSTMRTYLSRGENNVFVNVLSENYLLRDYMRYNSQMFISSPNAIPSFVPDYAKTERNMLCKLIIKMIVEPISEEEIQKEFKLAGIESFDVLDTLSVLLKKYTKADNRIFTLINEKETTYDFNIVTTNKYTIRQDVFEEYFYDTLKNAYFVLENEKDDEGYIDAKLFNHVTQCVLPGQFVCYDGKYYSVKYVSPSTGVILRRASDLFNGPKYYRQIRKYHLNDNANTELVSIRTMMDVEFAEIRTDISVDTTGYVELTDNHDLRNARVVSFANDPTVNNYSRSYKYKSVLRVRFPEASKEVLFTLCMLLSEVFRTTYPDSWMYLAVVTKRPENVDGILNYTTYDFDGEIEEGCIYIIEDSDIDIGLIGSVEKNFMTFMEIISDYLQWHFEKMSERAGQDTVKVPERIIIEEKEVEEERKTKLPLVNRIKQLFSRNKVEKVEVAEIDVESDKEKILEAAKNEISEEQIHEEIIKMEKADDEVASDQNANEEKIAELSLEVQTDEDSKEEEKFENAFVDNLASSKDDNNSIEAQPSMDDEDDLDIFEPEGLPEDNMYLEDYFQSMGIGKVEKTYYQRFCYLKFGFDEIDKRIEADNLYRYLRVRGWTNNELTKTRKYGEISRKSLDLTASEFCSFCGLPLTGISFDKLSDGRCRCNDCSTSSISSEEEFKKLFYQALDMACDLFEIKFNKPISAEMVDSIKLKKLAKEDIFGNKNSRIVSLNISDANGISFLVENGSPRLVTVFQIVQELTRAWQSINWDDDRLKEIYNQGSKESTDFAVNLVKVGMSQWVAVQYMYWIGEKSFADNQEQILSFKNSKNPYNLGFNLFNERYQFVKDNSVLVYSPFKDFPAVDPEKVKEVVKGQF